LAALAAANRTAFELAGVVVVDNASNDGSLEGLEQVDVPLRIIRNDRNRGYAAACNQGASVGTGELVLFLNPDTEVSPETLDLAVSFLVDPANERFGICGGRMLTPDGEDGFACARFPTLWMFVSKMLGLSELLPGIVPRQRMDAGELQRSMPVDQVIGAFFLLRRELFERLDGFDERFFVYLEEVDLAFRAAKVDEYSYYLAEARVLHRERVSSGQVPAKRTFYLLRSRTEFARKHWPAWQAVVLATMIVVVELPVRLVLAAGRGRESEMRDVASAARDYLSYLVRPGFDPAR
jgi:hypothetical protein